MPKLFYAKRSALLLFILTAIVTVSAQAQTTTTFTYQGRFVDSTVPQPTSGSYEMQYKLFDAGQVGTGLQIGATQIIGSVSVVNGIFTVGLDFGGAAIFRGTDVFLEIGVRPAGSANAFTILAPRQQITVAPLAIRSSISNEANNASNADALGGFPAGNFVQATDTRLFDDRNPLPGSTSYIQNSTALQTTSNFNISGTGTLGGLLSANVVNSQTNFSIGGVTIFSMPNSTSLVAGQFANHATTGNNSTFFGNNSGAVTTGAQNSFFGSGAGTKNTSGDSNSFVGSGSGTNNLTGGANSFFGSGSGVFNTAGNSNSFFGTDAGRNNKASDNSFFGTDAGYSNTNGTFDAFFGVNAGRFNTTGNGNAFFGTNAGISSTTGSSNSFFGTNADAGANNLMFATAIGAGAIVSTNNSVVLGRTIDTVIAPNLLQVGVLGAAGNTSLCRNALNQISTCTAGNITNSNNAQNTELLDTLRTQNLQMLEQLKAQQIEIEALKQIVCAANPAAKLCVN